ncbi:MAG: hypothetical protein KAT16_08150 [Candidatus Heimdallarchaeota archaeon]|nr:hypothetical protein [Candidatus Heimdallarchaeota archaeon]
MVTPIIAFAGLTVASLIKAVVAEYTANMGRRKLAQSFLVERVDSKLEKKFGKDFLKDKLTPHHLKEVREAIHEELGAYSSSRDLDQLITNSIQKLSNEHQQILAKLERVESLLEKISIPLSYSISKEAEDEVPEELLQGLLEGSLLGKQKSDQVLNELINEKRIPNSTLSNLENYNFIAKLAVEGETEMNRIINKFTSSPEDINSLGTLMDISALMVGPNEQLNNIVSEFVFRLIEQGIESSLVEKSIVAFTFLIHRLGKLDNLSESDRLLLTSFLKKNITDIDNPTRLLESYFLLTELGYATDINPDFVLEIMDRHYKRGVNTTNEMKDQLHVSGRMARFLRRIGLKSSKPTSSMRTIRILIKKLDKRKFLRNTHLLIYQLDRLTTEINLVISYFEKTDPSEEDLNELVELLQLLLEILNRPNILKLNLNTKKRIIELMDASYYLYDLLAVRNSWNLLNNYQINIKSLHTPTLGSYQRITANQELFNRSLMEYSRKRVEKVDRDLPSPPSKRTRKKITL